MLFGSGPYLCFYVNVDSTKRRFRKGSEVFGQRKSNLLLEIA